MYNYTFIAIQVLIAMDDSKSMAMNNTRQVKQTNHILNTKLIIVIDYFDLSWLSNHYL